jgi:basic membrane lipoprotein Med (substrate-binding protein (PBP1-ABC) superfamily)
MPRNEALPNDNNREKPDMTLTRLLATAAVALGLATTAMAQDKTKVGFIYVGPIGDGGWTYEHDKGRLAVETHFGDKVETVLPPRLAIWSRRLPWPGNSRM